MVALTYARVMFSHVQQLATVAALVTAPGFLVFALWTLAGQPFFAFINIWKTWKSQRREMRLILLMFIIYKKVSINKIAGD